MLHSILPKKFLKEEIILFKPADQISPIFWLESLHVVCILNNRGHDDTINETLLQCLVQGSS